MDANTTLYMVLGGMAFLFEDTLFREAVSENKRGAKKKVCMG